MRFLVICLSFLMLNGCCKTCHQFPELSSDPVVESDKNEYYRPMSGRVFHVAGFDIKEGQQMRDFFDDFEEPLTTAHGGNIVEWKYAVDYNPAKDKGKIVRYCEIPDHKRPLCYMKVTFDRTYVSNATSDCR